MSEDRLLLDYLNDILESITDIREFTAGMTKENFYADRKTIKAVVRSLEVIGEAAGKIPQDVRNKYPEIPWEEIVGMRNRLIHEYFGVKLKRALKVVREDLVDLKAKILKIKEDLR